MSREVDDGREWTGFGYVTDNGTFMEFSLREVAEAFHEAATDELAHGTPDPTHCADMAFEMLEILKRSAS